MASLFRAGPSKPDEYTPLGKTFMVVGSAIGVWGLGSIIYKYFSRSTKPLGKSKTKMVVNQLLQAFSQVLRQFAAYEQQFASRPDVTPQEMEMFARYMQSNLQQEFTRGEKQVLEANRVSSRQMKEACKLYADDREIAQVVDKLTHLISLAFPEAPNFPDDMTEEKIIDHLENILDLTISVMVEVFVALGGENLTKKEKLSPEFVKQLNTNYSQIYVKRRKDYCDEHELTDDLLSKVPSLLAGSPAFQQMLAKHQMKKKETFTKMGIMTQM